MATDSDRTDSNRGGRNVSLSRRDFFKGAAATPALGVLAREIRGEDGRSEASELSIQWKYGAPLQARMALARYYDPDKKHFRPYIFDPSTEWTAQKERAWQDYWDKSHWDKVLSRWSGEGYNMIGWIHAWAGNPAWQSFVLKFKEFPEAQTLAPDTSKKMIEHLTWLFRRAKELGMKNFLYTCLIHYSEGFAKAHGLAKTAGIRNELTRAYTEAAVAEVFPLYPDLDGLLLDVGEELPGDRTSFYKEAVVPGLRRCGRKPLMIVMNWQIPVDSFVEHIKPAYENTWLCMHAFNLEVITDTKPYPYAVEWAERVGLPTIMGILPSNIHVFPFNSPRFAYQMAKELKKVENVVGLLFWEWRAREIPPSNYLFNKALPYYSKNSEPYSERPWLDMLETRYGDQDAARHFLKAYDTSAPIIPETLALVWFSGDIRGLELRIPYEYFVGNFLAGSSSPRLTKTSPARGIYLIPVEDYVRIVAADPAKHENKNGEEPLYTTHIWDYGTFDVIPPAQMAKVRRMGEECFREAELAVKTVRKNQDEALREFNFMKAYMLLARYYEKKVMAAVYAWVYAKAGRARDKEKAETLADEALAAHRQACQFMLDTLNEDVTKLTGRPIGSGGWRYMELPEHMEAEKKDREKLAELFGWH